MPASLYQEVEEHFFSFAHEFDNVQRSLRNELVNATSEINELVQIYLPSILPGAVAPAPPPPPPPPAPLTDVLTARSTAFFRSHSTFFTGSAIAVTAVGVGYVGLGPGGRRRVWEVVSGAGERSVQACRDVQELKKAMERPLVKDGTRLEVVVLLGVDATPLGTPLALYLESAGFIVIASVSSAAVAKALEKAGHGYIRALVLESERSDAVEPFVAAAKSVLTMRFPINSPGDPYVSPSLTPQITSIISLLALPIPPPTSAAEIALQSTLHTPLAIINSLLPQLQAPLPATLAPASLRARATDSQRGHFLARAIEKKVVVLLPVQGNLNSHAVGLAGLEVTNVALRSAFASLASELANRSKTTAGETTSSDVKVNVMEVGFVSASRTVRPVEFGPRLRSIAVDWFESWREWARGRRSQSGFEVLEKAVGRCVGVQGRWAGRRTWIWPGSVSTWRVGAGSWTYSLLPAILPSQVFAALLALQRRAGLPTPTSPVLNASSTTSSSKGSSKHQSEAALKAGQAAAARAQAAAASSSSSSRAGPGRKVNEFSEEEEEGLSTDTGTDDGSGLTSSGMGSLGDSWVHDGMQE